jgi:hypothetical protein
MHFNKLAYSGRARFLISLEALETGTYQYFYDSYGNRHLAPSYWGDSYASRPGVLEFVDGLQNANPHSGHELMFKERLDPSYFTGIAVSDNQTRDGLMNYLRSHDIVQLDGSGHETILGIGADRFIQVSTNASEELFY